MAPPKVVCPENVELAEFLCARRDQLRHGESGEGDAFSKLDTVFNQAYKSVCQHKHPIHNLQEARKVRGIGAWLLNILKADFYKDVDVAEQTAPSEAAARRPKVSRTYLPQKNSAPYAILITLFRGTVEGEKEFMFKQELIQAADLSGLSSKPIEPGRGSGSTGRFGDSTRDWYSGWSSMKTLISKALVVKSNCPARYKLTVEGKKVAEECLRRSGLDVEQEVTHSQKSPARDDPVDSVSSLAFSSPALNHPATPSARAGVAVNRNSLATPPLRVGENFEDLYDVLLVLDDREQFARDAKGVSCTKKFSERLMVQYNIEVLVRHLPIGDAAWIARHKISNVEYMLDFIVERKRVDDLWISIKDNRYKNQKLQLQRCGIKRLIYLIEGDPNLTDATEALKTAAFSTELADGFDVQRTSDVHETMRRYRDLTTAIAARHQLESRRVAVGESTCLTFSEFVNRCKDLEKERISDVFAVQLTQVRLVTEDVALTIVEKYPTLCALVQGYAALEGNLAAQKDMLVGLAIRNKDKAITAAISKSVYEFIWAP